eukprot:12403795-Karenia_brevis.AAC.1
MNLDPVPAVAEATCMVVQPKGIGTRMLLLRCVQGRVWTTAITPVQKVQVTPPCPFPLSPPRSEAQPRG